MCVYAQTIIKNDETVLWSLKSRASSIYIQFFRSFDQIHAFDGPFNSVDSYDFSTL